MLLGCVRIENHFTQRVNQHVVYLLLFLLLCGKVNKLLLHLVDVLHMERLLLVQFSLFLSQLVLQIVDFIIDGFLLLEHHSVVL